jgi:hypothetical protein
MLFIIYQKPPHPARHSPVVDVFARNAMIAKHLNDGEDRGNDPEKDQRNEPGGVQPSIASAEGSRCEKQRPKAYAENGRSFIPPHWKPTDSRLAAPDLLGGSATKCSLDPDHSFHWKYTAAGYGDADEQWVALRRQNPIL